MLNFLWDFLFPKLCLGCKKEKTYLCENCRKQIKLDGKIYSDFSRMHGIDGLFCACVYEEKGLLAELIHQFKYNSAFALVEILKDFLINPLLKVNENLMKNSIVIPVPLHKKRLRYRGFNQSELLARKIAEKFNLEMDMTSLTRIRDTKSQAFLSYKERLTNVLDAFLFEMPEIKNKNELYEKILLVDDVVGTGSTLNESASSIKKLLPDAKIFGVALAKGVK